MFAKKNAKFVTFIDNIVQNFKRKMGRRMGRFLLYIKENI